MRLREGFWLMVDKGNGPSGCWPYRGTLSTGGYGLYALSGIREAAHRLAWRLSRRRPVPKRAYICHHCDNPPCCNPRHIYAGTAKSNYRDSVLRGRAAAHIKINAEQARDIRYRVTRGGTWPWYVAKEYGIPISLVARIKKGRWWRGYTEPVYLSTSNAKHSPLRARRYAMRKARLERGFIRVQPGAAHAHSVSE